MKVNEALPEPPAVRYCPFCGSQKLNFPGGVPRCMTCRRVFRVRYSRQLRAAAKKPASA